MSGNPSVPVLECRGLGVAFKARRGEVRAVDGFDLTVMAGECVGIVGESGSGKSSVALAIMRHLGPNGRIAAGDVLFNGAPMSAMNEAALRQVRGAGISMVYQEPSSSLNPTMKVGEQLAEVLVCHENAAWSEARRRAIEMLARVRVADPARVMAAYPHQLSGGQQQRAVIAMALLASPALMLLDEPTTALDATVEADILGLIRDIAREHGTAIVFISHDLRLIRAACTRVAVMYAGETVETGAVGDVLDKPRHPYTRALLAAMPQLSGGRRRLRPIAGAPPAGDDRPPGCAFAPRCGAFEPGRCEAARPALVPVSGDGHHVRCFRADEIAGGAPPLPDADAAAAAGPGRSILKIAGLTKDFFVREWALPGFAAFGSRAPVRANRDLDLTVHAAEFVAIVGESGSGKTTLGRIVAGLETASAGEAVFDGVEIAHLTSRHRPADVVRRIQAVFQNPFDSLNPNRRVGAQIARAVRKLGRGTAASARDRTLELLEMVRLPADIASRRPGQLSGGEKQRVAIARAFAGHPSLVVADEPVSALDASVQAAVAGLLSDLQRDAGTAFLFISHDLALVRHLADGVAVMYMGRFVERGATEQVFQPPYHPYTEMLLTAALLSERDAPAAVDEIPAAVEPSAGCPFHPRCPKGIAGICDTQPPPEVTLAPGHRVRCHLDPSEMPSASVAD